MRSARSIMILAGVTAAAIGGVFFVEREPDTVEHGGETVFPAVLDQVNSVARVRVTGKEGTFTLGRDGDTWVVEDKDRYAADPDRVHRLPPRRGGDEAGRAEDRQPGVLPEALARGSVRRGCEVGALRAGGRIGRRACGLGARRPPALEVRCRAAPSSTSALPATRWRGSSKARSPAGRRSSTGWNRLVARIGRERLRAAEVVHADGSAIAVGKSAPADTDFTLQGIPAGREGRFPVPHQRRRALPRRSALRGRRAGVVAGFCRLRGQARAGHHVRRPAHPPGNRDARRGGVGAVACGGRRRG